MATPKKCFIASTKPLIIRHNICAHSILLSDDLGCKIRYQKSWMREGLLCRSFKLLKYCATEFLWVLFKCNVTHYIIYVSKNHQNHFIEQLIKSKVSNLAIFYKEHFESHNL